MGMRIWFLVKFLQLHQGVGPGCRGARSQKTPEINLSRAGDIIFAQTFYLTPSELGERAC